MRLRVHTSVLLGTIVLGGMLSTVAAAQPGQAPAVSLQQKQVSDDIERALLRLPYYGVFDFLAFKYDKGEVTLLGYANRPTLKTDAERAVKRVSGVDKVVNEIEVLPLSPNDDEIRWRTFYSIYADPFLSRYAPGGGLLWGSRHGLRHPFRYYGASARFAGMEPLGNYPIHVIVNKGRVLLLGVVDNEADKTVAGMKARQVPGSFGIENELIIDANP